MIQNDTIQEAKAIGTASGKQDKAKQKHIVATQQKGRFVSSLRTHARTASRHLDTEVSSLQKHLTLLVKNYDNDSLTANSFKSRARIAIKQSTETAFILGVKSAGVVSPSGSPYPITKYERKYLDSYLKEELKYLDKFLNDVISKKSPGRIASRISLYANAIRSAYESGRVLSVGPEVIIHWDLESGNPCPDCRFLHKYSPYVPETLPTTPKGGLTRCLGYCYCTLRIVKSSRKSVDAVRKKSKSAAWIIKKIKESRRKK